MRLLDHRRHRLTFVRAGDTMGGPDDPYPFLNGAPRHLLEDTKHHRVTYTATSASRFREYFAQDEGLDFTRRGELVVVDVPASGRPLAPSVVYVVPTFGWQRRTETNLMRSVRFGGGLRVYLERPWFSSGEGERLGVALWNTAYGTPDRRRSPRRSRCGVERCSLCTRRGAAAARWTYNPVRRDLALGRLATSASPSGRPS